MKKTCYYCKEVNNYNEMVKNGQKVCSHCKRDLFEENMTKEQPRGILQEQYDECMSYNNTEGMKKLEESRKKRQQKFDKSFKEEIIEYIESIPFFYPSHSEFGNIERESKEYIIDNIKNNV